MTATIRATPKTNYLNNRDILKEIHLSKNTYCVFRDPVLDHQFDIILPSVSKINQKTIAEARRNRADRLKREGTIVDPRKIPNTDIVFRITCWEHIPRAAKKITKAEAKKRKLEDLLELDDITEDPLADLVEEPVLSPTHMRVNFPPYWHYRIDDNKVPFLVGRCRRCLWTCSGRQCGAPALSGNTLGLCRVHIYDGRPHGPRGEHRRISLTGPALHIEGVCVC